MYFLCSTHVEYTYRHDVFKTKHVLSPVKVTMKTN